ncbi:MAG: OmpA family protein [Bacteroidota bacterium]
MKKAFLLIGMGLVISIQQPQAQILKRLGENAKRKLEQKANEKIDKKIDDVVDGDKSGSSSGKSKKEKNADAASSENNESTGKTSGKSAAATLEVYSKFDFVSGEKVVAYEDFSQDNVGDFPDKWNTNSNGEIVNIGGKTGKWFNPGKDGVYLPEFITALPENFTFEFDLACNSDFSFYSTFFNVGFAQLKNPGKDFTGWKQYHNEGRTGVQIGFHPKGAGGSQGMTNYHVFSNGSEVMKNESDQGQFHAGNRLYAHISIWRQKQRLRVYINENKVWDVPRAFESGNKYNSVIFQTASFSSDNDKYYIANLRLAVGAPDTRNKLITEGKFVTSGILFDFQSAVIRPESYGIIKEIAGVLNDNADVKVKIIGHTSNDGDAGANLELSKKRAAAVKDILVKNFNISDSRLTTDGKGGSEPTDKGTTAEAKANNRRVEFIKQ